MTTQKHISSDKHRAARKLFHPLSQWEHELVPVGLMLSAGVSEGWREVRDPFDVPDPFPSQTQLPASVSNHWWLTRYTKTYLWQCSEMLRMGLNHNPAVDTIPELWEPSGSHLGRSSLTLKKLYQAMKQGYILFPSFFLFVYALRILLTWLFFQRSNCCLSVDVGKENLPLKFSSPSSISKSECWLSTSQRRASYV